MKVLVKIIPFIELAIGLIMIIFQLVSYSKMGAGYGLSLGYILFQEGAIVEILAKAVTVIGFFGVLLGISMIVDKGVFEKAADSASADDDTVEVVYLASDEAEEDEDEDDTDDAEADAEDAEDEADEADAEDADAEADEADDDAEAEDVEEAEEAEDKAEEAEGSDEEEK